MKDKIKTRIAIVGIGAVGGYFGGLLAKKYYKSEEVEIIFIVRESTENVIREKGLRVITSTGEINVFPHQLATRFSILEPVDYLICCTKSYDLEESLSFLNCLISSQTIILPLYNGIDARERIRKMYPSAEVASGCVYLLSRLIEPGIVKQEGNIHSLYFGSESAPASKLNQLKKILLNAEIECCYSRNIKESIWEKFIFVSSIATLTSYLNLTIRELIGNENHIKTLIELINELKLIADAERIRIPENITEKILDTLRTLPFGSTSSMHSDYRKGAKTEYRSLTEYVSLLGDKWNIDTPVYDNMTSEFRLRETKVL